jgi:hypothetical protein
MKKIFVFVTFMLISITLVYSGNDLTKNEIKEKRTSYSKTYSLGENRYRTIIHSKPIHILNEMGQYIEINAQSDVLSQENLPGAFSFGVYGVYVNGSLQYRSTDGNFYVGRYTVNDTTYRQYKCFHGFSLQNITDDAIIDTAWYEVDQNTSVDETFTVSLKHMASYSGSANDLWWDIGDGRRMVFLKFQHIPPIQYLMKHFPEEVKFARISKQL